MQRHNPGVLKQTNKEHKVGKHKSKGSISKNAKGKTAVINISNKKSKNNLNRLDRKNHLMQIRKNKRAEILNKKRLIGSFNGAPHIISLIPLSRDVNCTDVLDILLKCDNESVSSLSDSSVYSLKLLRLNTQFNFVIPNSNNINSVLDAVKISDTCLFVISSENCMDDFGTALLEQIQMLHLPASLFIIKGLEAQRKIGLKGEYQKLIESKCAGAKLFVIESSNDALNVLHRVSQHKLKEMPYCIIRPYMLVDKLDYIPNNHNTRGTLKICGYLRGKNLNIQNSVHLPTLGTFRIKEIDILKTEIIKKDNKLEKNEEWKCILRNNHENNETLQMDEENEDSKIEDINNNINDASVLVRKKVPVGTSEYQAAWILNSESEDDDEDENTSSDKLSETTDKELEEENEMDENEHNMVENDPQISYESENFEIESQDDLENFKMMEKQELDPENPDMVDTPQNISAKIRFKKYRGLKSFRTSPWDPNENLPEDYTKIFKFENFRKTFNKIKNEEPDGAEPGWYIMIHLMDVPKFNIIPNHPITMFGLLKHEDKMSVINILLKRNPFYNSLIKSKEPLTFHIGARRFTASPIFSEHSNGDKHKFERYMPENNVFIATIYGPITYPPAPVLVFKALENGSSTLVASGSILSTNPDRIILKRLILHGHPYKVQNRHAVVRFMFHNPDDVNWFKPVELRTKMGKIGHIKEPLGTHGHMKCLFNDSIKAQETVMMYLYKRVYPKWTYEEKCNDFVSQYDDQNEN